MSRKTKKLILMLNDLVCVGIGALLTVYLISYYVQTDFSHYSLITGIYYLIYVLAGLYFHNFSALVRFFGLRDAQEIVISNLLAGAGAFIAGTILFTVISHRYLFLLTLFAIVGMLLTRVIWRLYIDRKNGVKLAEQEATRLLIVGAGQAGNLFIENFSKHPEKYAIIGAVDNDPQKQNIYIKGVPILGKLDDIPQIVDKKRIDMITITAPSMPAEVVEQVVRMGNDLDITVNQMPAVERVLAGEYKMAMKEIEISDLLGRKEIELDDEPVIDSISNQVILVTGAGGSIGSEICRQIIRFGPAQLILLGHGENSIYLINQELRNLGQSNIKITPVIADIQDREHLDFLMQRYQPDIVYHAAAHKHVPLMEWNPTEAVKNNIYGTYNVAKAAEKAGVKKFVMISTDKANNPPNVMGATKRIAEMIVTGLNKDSQTTFSAVRFGNVLGSRGSVIPLFKKQIAAGGPVTVTHPDMRRYFMTIPEASRLVIQAGALAEGGELFILNMGEEVYIKDLAKKMIALSGHSEDEIEITYTGMRPGEKLYEELLLNDETTDRQIDENIFVGRVHNKSLEEIKAFVDSLDLVTDRGDLNEKLTSFVHRDV
ncbi:MULTISPECIES: nucleoside-diphosphate sugar epimerase/dehydratase [unclassified Aerococcus]|uniref:nucleoside-diphosphate sugar epimerase/dehydratase n=1 Tax=unclassified Aerococcus TaxID=2618060 RepID=UPI0008A3374D|nr:MULTISPECIES: nucleoside-diphosphate sugar epimerase/dehydratase [unclassified Aerococcus]MDK6368349.1 nucleoside-diphosphate sugar epimerase/dehydratase [Aerococcus sp. UMB9870]MDK6679431.1 nucleoside-diphosphate sugar epimerase/dehydratase [Aerococcus sp. UMB8608]MDK6687196.1 nucleoside-diphosphate sugar epimerase/dehydratase [Aerococcus sp. UMB8623]MDK6941105.1 nucleoside-diphosphate sugar epimerase/dehydratase [Aerococcus sp. UMB8487]OFR34793.1 short-chain dehydrogenase [Aerococcus sp. 